MKPIALVANGEIKDLDLIASIIRKYPRMIAVDGGLGYCDLMGITPELIIGDFDSASKALREKYIQVKQIHTPDPQKTDLEKALELVPSQKWQVFGALGKRTDHTLTNIYLLARYPGRLFFETEHERLFVIDRECSLSCNEGQILSLIPVSGEAKGVTTSGLKWELKNATLSKTFVSISNITTHDRIEITCESGDLLLCLNK